MVALCTFKNLSRSWWINVRLLYSQHFLNSTANITQHSCFCVSLMTTYNWQLNYLSKEYSPRKEYFAIMLYTLFFCSAVHSMKSRVMEGTGSTVAAQSWRYCSVHVISRNWQILRRVSAGFSTISMLGTSIKLPGRACLTMLHPSAKLK